MSKRAFWGADTAFSQPVTDRYPDIRSPQDLYDALLHLWCAETCAPRMRQNWSAENPTLGQCSVTAFLAQDIFGGEVFGIPLKNGSVHCFNVAGGYSFDLTCEQFGSTVLDYTVCTRQSRDAHFAKVEKRARYELLCRLLGEYTGKNK